MYNVLKNMWPLMLGMLLLMLGNGLQGTLIGVRGAIEEIETASLGVVMSAYFIGFMGGSTLAPLLIQRVGHVRVFAALGSTVSAAFILYAAYVDPVFWFFLRLVVGFCFSGIYVVAESWLNDSSTNETRGQSLSLYLMVQMMGIVLGQLLLNVADPGGYGLFILISVLVSMSFAPILLSTSPAPVYETAQRMTLRQLVVTSPLACVGMFLLGGVFAALFGMASVYATGKGFSIAGVSYFVTAIYVGGMLFQYPIGWLSDRIDRRILIIGVTAVAVAISAAAPFLSDTLPGLVFVAFILGGTSNPLYSLLIAYANDYLEQDQMSSASGGLLFINGFGAMGGPIVVGYVMEAFGLDAFFAVTGTLMALICVYGIYRMTQRSTVAAEDVGQYVAITNRVSQVAAEIALDVAEDYESEEADAQP